MAETTIAGTDMHRSVLIYRDGLYGKAAALLVLIGLLVYWVDRPEGGVRYGGTWLGYVYGTLAVLLIVWLAWFGVRKRQYGPKRLLLEEWLSAHVYLGLAVLVIGTLHTGFHFHWNVHTAAYVLMVLVIVSGTFGIYAYRRYPALLTANRGGTTLRGVSAELATVDLQCQNMALGFDDKTLSLVQLALEEKLSSSGVAETLFGRSTGAVLSEKSRNAVEHLRTLIAEGAPLGEVLHLVQALTLRATLIARARRDQRYRVLMTFWRAVHVPLTIGLLVALFAHIFSVFYYW